MAYHRRRRLRSARAFPMAKVRRATTPFSPPLRWRDAGRLASISRHAPRDISTRRGDEMSYFADKLLISPMLLLLLHFRSPNGGDGDWHGLLQSGHTQARVITSPPISGISQGGSPPPMREELAAHRVTMRSRLARHFWRDVATALISDGLYIRAMSKHMSYRYAARLLRLQIAFVFTLCCWLPYGRQLRMRRAYFIFLLLPAGAFSGSTTYAHAEVYEHITYMTAFQARRRPRSACWQRALTPPALCRSRMARYFERGSC